MKYALFVLLGFSSFSCFAQDSAEYRACSDKANTQAEMTAKAAEYGSMYPLDVALLRAKLTKCQVTALEDMLQHYTAK